MGVCSFLTRFDDFTGNSIQFNHAGIFLKPLIGVFNKWKYSLNGRWQTSCCPGQNVLGYFVKRRAWYTSLLLWVALVHGLEPRVIEHFCCKLCLPSSEPRSSTYFWVCIGSEKMVSVVSRQYARFRWTKMTFLRGTILAVHNPKI